MRQLAYIGLLILFLSCIEARRTRAKRDLVWRRVPVEGYARDRRDSAVDWDALISSQVIYNTEGCTWHARWDTICYPTVPDCGWGLKEQQFVCVTDDGVEEIVVKKDCFIKCGGDRITDCADTMPAEMEFVEATECSLLRGVGHYLEQWRHKVSQETTTCRRKCCCDRRPAGGNGGASRCPEQFILTDFLRMRVCPEHTDWRP